MQKMKLKSLSVLVFLCIAGWASAQVDSVYMGHPDTSSHHKPKDHAWIKKITYGGNFQGWIGNPTFIYLSPTIGYTFFRNFNAGVGGVYSYSSFDFGSGSRYKQSL